MTENTHIEEFFRKQLSSNEFAFQEEDWLKMEKKLELAGIPSSGITPAHFPLKIIIIILAALTAAFFLGWLTSEFVRNIKSNKGESLQNSTSPVINAQSTNPPKIEIKSPGNPAVNLPEQSFPANTRQSDNLKIQLSESDQNTLIDTSFEKEESSMPVATINPIIESIENDLQAGTIDSFSDDQINKEKNHEMLSHRNADIILLPLQTNIDRISLDHSVVPLELSVEKSGSIPIRSHLTRLSIGLLIAPDLNSTGIFHNKRMSPVFGGTISFALSYRWSLSARILYNNKKYRSSADYYRVSDEYWQNRTNGILPDNIDGSCRVLDVPVLLTYRFYQKKAISLTASAGLGSYFLLDEKYQFTFRQDNPGAATQWQTEDNSQVLFGIANLAMGFSLRTSPRTSIGIEPYLKLPLKKMGWGQVNLSGMGLSFSINYHF